jgi:FlaA1/EpsC-like NDP-sugar epimerase
MHCLVLLVIDLLLISVSNASAVILCVDLQSAPGSLFQLFSYCSLTVAAAVPVVLATGLNRTLWRFTSLHDCLHILLATAMTVFAAAVAATMFDRMHGVPRSLPIMQCLTMASTLVGIRALMRLRHSRRNRWRNTAIAPDTAREDILIVGINAVAELFLRCVAENGARISVAGILSDGNRHRGRRLRSYVCSLKNRECQALRRWSRRALRAYRPRYS